MRIIVAVAAVLFAVMLGGCTASSPEPNPVGEPSSAAPDGSAPTEEYSKVRALVADMAANGVSCEDMAILDAPQESIADFGLCFIDGEKEFETDIYLFDDEESRDSWHGSLAGYPEIHTLLGANWFITSGSVDELEQIRTAIGGEIDAQREE